MGRLIGKGYYGEIANLAGSRFMAAIAKHTLHSLSEKYPLLPIAFCSLGARGRDGGQIL